MPHNPRNTETIRSFAVSALLAGLLAALLVGLSVWLYGCSAQEDEVDYGLVNSETLTVAASFTHEPFEYLAGETPTGYSVAVIQEAASRLGLSCAFVSVRASSVLQTLADGGVADVGITTLPITSEAKKTIRLTTPYHLGNQMLIVKKGTFESADELKGCEVATVAKSSAVNYITSELDAEAVGRASVDSCFEALDAGRVSGIVVNESMGQVVLATSGEYEILERVASNNKFCFVVHKSNSTLCSALSDVIKEMEADGTIAQLQDEYL